MSDPGVLVVVGASAGGIEALQTLVAALPEDFGAAVCVVLHLSPSLLPEIGVTLAVARKQTLRAP